MKKKVNTWIASAIMIFSGFSQALADTVNWAGYGATSRTGLSWNDSTNWNSGKLPGSDDTARFGFTNSTPATAKTITLDAPQTVGQLQFPSYGSEPALSIGNAADVAAGNTLTLSSVFRDDNVGNTQTLVANIMLATNSYWDVRPGYNGGVTVSGTISGLGMGLTKTGNGTLTLQGASFYSGYTTVGAGTLVLQNTNSYTGDTTVKNSTLSLSFNASTAPFTNIVNDASVLKMGAATVSISGKNTANVKNSQTVNGLTLNPGNSAFSIVNGIASGSSVFSLGAISRNTGSTVNFSQPTINSAISAINGYVTVTGNDMSGILGGYATVASADWAANNGVNVVAYTGYTTLVGDAQNIVDGTNSNVRISNASTGNVGQDSATVTINTLLAKDSVARNVIIGSGNTLRLGAVGGLLTPSGTGPLTIDVAGSAGTLTAGGADNTSGELIINNATTITNNASIADNGSGPVALTKSGSGSLVINTVSTHTGGTVLNGGTLILPGGINPLATNSALTVVGGTFNLGGAIQTNTTAVSVLGGTVTNGTLVLIGTNYMIEAGRIATVLRGSVGLDKSTAGALILSGANTYTGDTVIREGSLAAGIGTSGTVSVPGNLIVGSPSGGLPATVGTTGGTPFNSLKNFTVYSNGALSFGGAAQYLQGNLTLIGGSFTGTQPYFQTGSAVFMTGGVFGGIIYGNGNYGITSYSNASPAIVSASLRGNNHTFTVNRGSGPIDLLFTGNMVENGKTLTKSGAGVMASSGGNTYSITAVTAGTLLVNNTSGSGTGNGAVTVNAGSIFGGTGFIGGVANYSNANVTATGTSGNPAVVAPGSIDPTTGDHIIGTLTVGNLAVQTNNVTFSAYSTLKVNIATNGACDKLVVNGTLSLITLTDTLEMNVADVAALNPGTYTLVTYQQRAAGPDQEFSAVVGKPTRGRLEYTATSLNYVIDPTGTLITIL